MFRVGDRVHLRDDLVVGQRYGIVPFLESMEVFSGGVVTISYIDEDIGICTIEEDDRHVYSPSMFDGYIYVFGGDRVPVWDELLYGEFRSLDEDNADSEDPVEIGVGEITNDELFGILGII